jgi:hypothetical protein
MWITVTDTEQAKVTINSQHLVAILRPSPLSRGDGKCRILASGIMIEVSRSEADRVARDVPEFDPLPQES